MLRACLVLVMLAWLAAPGHADPIELAFAGRHAAVPAGSDHGEWNGVDIALETAPLRRISLRLDAALDQVTMHSDECTWKYDGTQVTGLAGVRVDLVAPRPGQLVRPFYAASVGAGAMRTSHCQAMATTAGRFYVEPVRLGLDVALAASTALRVEGAVLVQPSDYDPLALIIDAGLAFRL